MESSRVLPPLLVIAASQPDRHREILPCRLAHRLQYLPMEPGPVFHRLGAIGVGPVIGQGRIELIQQIAVGRVDFYPIEARLSGPPGGLAKCLSRLLDLPDRHFCRQFFLLLGVTEGTGANRRLPRYLGRGSGAGMA